MKFRESEIEVAQQRKAEFLKYQRASRNLLHSKQRSIGQPVFDLDRQMEEKCQAEYQEKVAEEEHAAYEKSVIQAMNKQAAKLEMDRRQDRHALEQAWKHQARNRYNRPEGDLNRPDILKIDTYPKDDLAGVSSAQYFRGEDQNPVSTKKSKQEFQRRFIEEQLEENRLAEEAERYAEEMHANLDRQQIFERAEMERNLALDKRHQDLSVLQANQELSQIRKNRDHAILLTDHYEALREKSHVEESALLAESRHGYIVRQEWKGMRPEELSEIRQGQSQQRADNVCRDMEEKEYESKEASHHEYIRQSAVSNARQNELDRKQRAIEMQEFLKKQQHHRKMHTAMNRDDEYSVQPVYYPFGKSLN